MKAEWFTFRSESGRGDGLRAGTEVWDDGNTTNSDGFKTPASDEETSNTILNFEHEF